MTLNSASDLTLLRQYADEGSHDAFAELVRRHLNLVYAAALRQLNGDVHLARDVVQIVFTDLARKAPKLTAHRVLAGWLHTSSRYAAAKLIRTEHRHQMRNQEAQVMSEFTRDDSAPINWAQLQPLIDDALGRLRPAERDAILLRFFEDHPYAEIAGRLGMTESAARSVVDRGVAKLGGILARRGIASTATAVAAALAGQIAVATPIGIADSVAASALASAAAAETASSAATVFTSLTKLQLGIVDAVVSGVFVACVLISAGQRPASPAPTVSVPQRDTGLKRTQNPSQTTQIWSRSVASDETRNPRRNERHERDIRAMRTAEFGIVSTIYRPFLDRLNISLAVRQQFLNLVCNERGAAYDVVSTAGANNLSYLTDPTIERMALDAATSADGEIRALLTPDEFSQFIDYRNMHIIQVSVSILAESIADGGGTPLTDAQMRDLIKIFFDHLTPGQLRRAPVNAVLNLRGFGVTEEIIGSARTLLSDQQLAALVALRASQLAPSHDKIGAPPQSVGNP